MPNFQVGIDPGVRQRIDAAAEIQRGFRDRSSGIAQPESLVLRVLLKRQLFEVTLISLIVVAFNLAYPFGPYRLLFSAGLV